ncbi:MAG: hypothetical protein NTX64_05960, partial [Elusimicrobia bacterium]|nr:hypothetical protein [Elusimicrobiota bacterium]
DIEASLPAPDLGFSTGDVLEHPEHGVGVVLGTRRVSVGEQSEAALEVRFADGRTRTVVPRLAARKLRLVTRAQE